MQRFKENFVTSKSYYWKYWMRRYSDLAAKTFVGRFNFPTPGKIDLIIQIIIISSQLLEHEKCVLHLKESLK